MDTTATYAFCDGNDLSGISGIELAATTGYSSSTEVEIHFAVAAYGCGPVGS